MQEMAPVAICPKHNRHLSSSGHKPTVAQTSPAQQATKPPCLEDPRLAQHPHPNSTLTPALYMVSLKHERRQLLKAGRRAPGRMGNGDRDRRCEGLGWSTRRGMCVSDPEAGMKTLKVAPSLQTVWSAQRGYNLPETLQLYF